MAKAGAFGENEAVFVGGADASTVLDLRQRARRQATVRRTTLTDEALRSRICSWTDLAVADARVFPGMHPGRPNERTPGCRTVVVTPQRAAVTAATRILPRGYLREIRRRLERDRVLGETLWVIGVQTVPVSVQAELLVQAGVNPTAIHARAVTRVNAKLSEVQIDPEVAPLRAGQAVLSLAVERELVRIPEVVAVQGCVVQRVDLPGENRQEAIALKFDQVAVGADHRLRVTSLPAGGQ